MPKKGPIDPSRTTTLRNQYMRAMSRRWNAVKRRLREWVVDQDGLGFHTVTIPMGVQIPMAPESPYTDRGRRLTEFLEVTNTALREELGLDDQCAWCGEFLERAYRKGRSRGRQELRKAYGLKPEDLVTTLALDDDPLSLLEQQDIDDIKTMNYTYINGLTAADSAKLGQILADAMVNGLNPNDIASAIAAQLGIDINRARTIARTEMMRAHHRALYRQYSNANVDDVEVIVEWVNTPDSHTCDFCASMDGRKFPLEEMKDALPAHPNCRCVMVPVVDMPWKEK